MNRKNGFITVFLLTMLFLIADRWYREVQYEKYAEDMAFYRHCMILEKNWIANQQTKEGTICLYEMEEEKEGVMVPYFSCMAALGMLAGDVSGRDLEVVEKYLSWHCAKIVQRGGVVSDYSITDGELIAKNSYDSVDSYIALYLKLLAVYAEKGGSLEDIPYAEESVDICVKRLKKLTCNGLTKVSESKDVYYLMDNLEVLEALEDMDRLLSSGNDCIMKWANKESLAEYFKRTSKQSKQAIKSTFWNEQEERFEIGVDGQFSYLEYQENGKFYPYAISQVYAVACNIDILDKKTMQILYDKLSMEYEWVTLKHDTTFEWPVMSFISMKMGDVETTELYLQNYRKKYHVNRGYPFKVTDAAWAARTYEQLYIHYEKKANKGLIDFFLKR